MGRVTDPSKPRGHKPASGGPASVRAATRVKPEQASKALMRAPSLDSIDEGRRGPLNAPTCERGPARRGSGRSTYARGDSQHGRSVGPSGYLATAPWETEFDRRRRGSYD